MNMILLITMQRKYRMGSSFQKIYIWMAIDAIYFIKMKLENIFNLGSKKRIKRRVM